MESTRHKPPLLVRSPHLFARIRPWQRLRTAAAVIQAVTQSNAASSSGGPFALQLSSNPQCSRRCCCKTTTPKCRELSFRRQRRKIRLRRLVSTHHLVARSESRLFQPRCRSRSPHQRETAQTSISRSRSLKLIEICARRCSCGHKVR